MLPLLLAIAPAIPIVVEPQIPVYMEFCDEVLYELEQGVEFGIITPEQSIAVYVRCLVNYS